MKERKELILYLLLLLSTLINCVYAADESSVDQFLGNPLLILAAVIVIDIIAFIYHKLRK